MGNPIGRQISTHIRLFAGYAKRMRSNECSSAGRGALEFWGILILPVWIVLSGCVGKVPEEVYAEGRKAFDAVNYEEARQHFEEFVRKYPNHGLIAPAYYFLGRARARLGNSTGAIEAFVEVEKKAEEPTFRINSQVYLAALYRERGEWKASLDKLQHLIDVTSGDTQKNFAIEYAQTLRESGEIEEASAYLWGRASETSEPSFRGEYLLSLADIYWATETVEPMLVVLSEIIQDASIPQELRVQAFYWRGRALEQTDRFDEAAQNFQELQETFPGTIDAVEAKVALAILYQEKDAELAESHLREATEEFARLIADATESAETRSILRARMAEAYFRFGKYEEAIAAYEKILLLNPEDDQVQKSVGRRVQQIRDAYARESVDDKGLPHDEG
jgi:TolA-binding protein